MHYILVFIADLLFSSQFFMTKLYSRRTGKSLKASLSFSIGTYTVIAIYMFIANGCRLAFAPFSLMMASIAAINSLICAYASIASLEKANLSVYSVFLMLGPITISPLFGILFLHEGVTLGMLIGILLIAVSLYFSIDKSQKGGKGAIKYYFICFFANGLSGVIAKIHQHFNKINIPSNDYLIWFSICAVLMSTVLLLIITRGKNTFGIFKDIKNIGCMTGYAAFHGIAELLSLITLAALPVSLQQPLVTGGVLAFSFIISLLCREKLTLKSAVSFVFALAATLCVSLLTQVLFTI